MSVLLETSLGDIVIDLFVKECPKACENFLKLCKLKKYNNYLFLDVQKDYLAQVSEAKSDEGTSVWGLLNSNRGSKYFPDEPSTRPFDKKGLVAMASRGPDRNAAAFFITLGDLSGQAALAKRHSVFGQVAEGLEVLTRINEAYLDPKGRPYQNIRIKHTLIIDDPFQDPPGLKEPSRSPSPVAAKEDAQYLEDNLDL